MTSVTVKRKIIIPFRRMITQSSTSGILLFIVTIISLIIANSPFSDSFQQLWNTKIGFNIGSFSINKPLLLWINDGLMSVFFFVVGLELKREIVAGELSNRNNATIPFIAGIGGMLVPALIYYGFNSAEAGEALIGWGIPMATDIAFALGVLYLLGNRVPLSLKVFITALAIIDDLGAVLVIALFYTSEISLTNLATGGGFLATMALANIFGIRSTLFYGILGIGGLWLAFLLSGVHATIAAVLAAFTIPSKYVYDKETYLCKAKLLVRKYSLLPKNKKKLLAEEQYLLLDNLKKCTDKALPPLQKIEHSLHSMVAFIILPIFALANAGVSFSGGFLANLNSPISLGIIFGLIFGKVIGIVGSVYLADKLKLIHLPNTLTYPLIIGTGFLAAIGFTMSLFITSLAFENEVYIYQAKIGILTASLIAGALGYFILKSAINKEPMEVEKEKEKEEVDENKKVEVTVV
jgi:Na+:H+ antiporter, NhaA family